MNLGWSGLGPGGRAELLLGKERWPEVLLPWRPDYLDQLDSLPDQTPVKGDTPNGPGLPSLLLTPEKTQAA